MLNGVYEFKLSGYLFVVNILLSNVVMFRRMVGVVLQRFNCDGWKFFILSDLIRILDLIMWIFKKVLVVILLC